MAGLRARLTAEPRLERRPASFALPPARTRPASFHQVEAERFRGNCEPSCTRLNNFALVVGECCRENYSRRRTREKPLFYMCFEGVERVMGIEPTWPAWKAGALPLSYTRMPERLSVPYLLSTGQWANW